MHFFSRPMCNKQVISKVCCINVKTYNLVPCIMFYRQFERDHERKIRFKAIVVGGNNNSHLKKDNAK